MDNDRACNRVREIEAMVCAKFAVACEFLSCGDQEDASCTLRTARNEFLKMIVQLLDDIRET